MIAAVNTRSSQAGADTKVALVADMLDALAAGDRALTITGLEDLLARLRAAEAARELLIDVDRDTLMAALMRRRARGGAQQ